MFFISLDSGYRYCFFFFLKDTAPPEFYPLPLPAAFPIFFLVLAVRGTSAQTPALTTISDTVFRADGSPAAGTLLISWLAFTATGGQTVAAGSRSVTLDRKSTRLNSSHGYISYAVFCLKKK